MTTEILPDLESQLPLSKPGLWHQSRGQVWQVARAWEHSSGCALRRESGTELPGEAGATSWVLVTAHQLCVTAPVRAPVAYL